MAEEINKNKQYWKEIGLLILGALLASIPTLIAANMHNKTELQRLTIDQQLSALKALSAYYSDIATKVLPSIENSQFEINNCIEKSDQKQMSYEDCTSIIKREHISMMNISRTNWAEYNSQQIVVKALFHVDLPHYEFYDFWKERKTESKDVSREESVKRNKDSNDKYRQSLINLINSGQGFLNILAAKIKLN